MAKTELATASVLAFERKLDPSDGLFSAGRWEDITNSEQWPAIGIHEKSVRGTISNRLKAKDQDPAKLDAAIENPNLQTVDVATLPNDADTLRVRFTLRVLGGAGAPSACNNALYLTKLQAMVQSYVGAVGFGELAQRYAVNLANGRFLWRNRVGAEEVLVEVRHLIGGKPEHIWQFNALDFSLRDFKTPDKDEVKAHLDQLTAVIQAGLAGESYTLLEVVAFARVGDGQEVYPSQELILDKGDKKGQKSKTLYHVNEVAALHSQKIGNALRTIDTWYPNEAGDALGPIAVEPYGSVTNQGRAYRQPKDKADFYSLLDGWVLKDKAPDKDNQHFVMATLIRGGVFGESDKE
ncbi:MAG: type I-F CRISPR-associated protein Csy3 [Candidatus Competibacteraceae bacterium]|nr:type I-F CRISPR-associated protein Csy3 [Candidatus Competibacteraceae bacterium]